MVTGVEESQFAELCRSAALDGALWVEVLARLAERTGASSGNLVGVRPGQMAFEWADNMDPQVFVDYDESIRGDPATNPRVRNGLTAAPMQIVSGIDYASDEWTRAFPIYGEACRRYDIGGGSQIVLHRSAAGLVGLATMRTARQGAATAEQVEIFGRLARHVRDGVRLRRMVEDQGPALALGALEALAATAFLIDELGGVRAMTRAAEALVGPGGPLRLKAGRLSAESDADTDALAMAVARAQVGGVQGIVSVVVQSKSMGPLVVEAAPLPREPWSLALHPLVLLTVKRRPRPPTPEQLRIAFGLTMAEAEITLMLGQGVSRERIAAARNVSIGTIKSQLQSIFEKLGVRREIEIPVLLSGL